MKKLTFSIVLTLFAIVANAQSTDKKLNFGVKAGVNLPDARIKYSGKTIKGDGIAGFYLGGFATVDIVENICFQPELLFSHFGAKTPDGSTKTSLNYITIPLLVKYNLADFGFYAGPQIGVLASAKLKFEEETRNAKEDIKSTDFAGIVGAEYYLKSGLGFSLRYVLSLNSIAKDDSYKEKHNVIQAGVNYRF